MSKLQCFIVNFLALFLYACAGTSTRNVNETAVNALYVALDQANLRYETALALARNGEGERAHSEIKKTLDELRTLAQRCGQLAGCDTDRFFSSFDRLLRINADNLTGDIDDEEETVNEEVTMEAGEDSPVIAALPEIGRTVTLLKGRELGDVIALNGPVKVALEEWLTQYRPNLMDAYENYQYMRYRMWPEYQKGELPEALLFGILAKESGGKVHAVSRSGASGPLQFMYTTGLRFGLSTVNGFDQRFDAGLATKANVAYINEQLRIFNNNVELVLAAYNAGEGRMKRLADKSNNLNFWDPSIYYELSAETRDYVPMVLAAAWLFMHPERYHLEFPKIDGKPGSITLKEPMSIAELTICLGQEGNVRDGWFRTLRNLNPSFDHQQTIPAGTVLEVPAQLETVYGKSCATGGPWMVLANELHEAVAPVTVAHQPAPTSKSRSYVVRKGDTLAQIARKADCGNISSIAQLNGIRAPHYPLRIGQSLDLPKCSAR